MAYVYSERNVIGKTEEFEPIEEGTYEVVVDSAQESTTKSGRPVFKVRYRIRRDVEQAFQNRVVFDDLYKAEGDDHYNQRRLNSILKAIGGVQDGQTFETIGDIARFIAGGELRVRITKEEDSYDKSGFRNRIVAFFPSEEKTEVQSVDDVDETEVSPTTSKAKPHKVKAEEFDDDDLPF